MARDPIKINGTTIERTEADDQTGGGGPPHHGAVSQAARFLS